MLNMIKADLYRIFKGKGVYFALLVLFISLGISIFAMQPGHIGFAEATKESRKSIKLDKEIEKKLVMTNSITETRKIVKENAEFELDKQIIGTNVNLYYLFIVIVAIVITTDFSNSTIKNTLSSAISRKKYYLSKFFTCMIITTIVILLNNYGMYTANILVNGSKFASSFIDITKLTLMQMPMLYGIMSILIFISYLTRKMSVYNDIAIPLIIASQMILMGIASVIKINGIMKYELQYAMANLALNPTNSYIITCILIGIGYIVIFNFLGYKLFEKTEIK